MSEETHTWLIPTVVALAAAAALWYFQSRTDPPTEPVETSPSAVVDEAERDDRPRYPLPLPAAERPPQEELTPLPSLDDSDSYLELALVDVFGGDIGEWLVSPALIEKIVATVDSLPRVRVPEQIRPIRRLPDAFAVDGQDDSGEFTPSTINYARFDGWMTTLSNTDPVTLAATYRRFYPLFQEAYVNLGYPNSYFNDRLVEVIDHLLETPTLDTLPELSRPNVLYEYADPELEALSGGQKALLRMGPRHVGEVRLFLNAFRDAIAGSDPAGGER